MSTIYLVTGSTGAGKSTYSRKLSLEKNCLRFSVDEWMIKLFEKDQPIPIEYEWALERVIRIEDMVLTLLPQFLQLNQSAILDFGFFEKKQRQRVKKAIIEMGFKSELHYLDVNADTRWQRVEKRNHEKGETFSLEVTRQMFDFCENLYQRPESDEAPFFIN